jgi:hypothetical protein
VCADDVEWGSPVQRKELPEDMYPTELIPTRAGALVATALADWPAIPAQLYTLYTVRTKRDTQLRAPATDGALSACGSPN